MKKYLGNWTFIVILIVTLGTAYCLQKWPKTTILCIIGIAVILYIINPEWYTKWVAPACKFDK